MESSNMSDHAAGSSETFQDKPLKETAISPVAPAPITRYYSIMDDEGADDVFIHQPPAQQASLAPRPPAEGSTSATASNSGMTPPHGAADATEAEANPSGLDWHQSEKELMEERSEPDEVIPSKESSKDSTDNRLLLGDKDSAPSAYQDPVSADATACLMEACQYGGGEHGPGHQEPDKELEDIAILSEEEKNWEENDGEKDKYPQQTASNSYLNFEKETFLEKEVVNKDSYLHEKDFKQSRDNQESDNLESSTQVGITADKFDLDSSETARSHESRQRMMGEAPVHPPAVNISADTTNDDEGHVDSRSLDYNLTRSDWVRRESGPADNQISHLPLPKSLEEMVEEVEGVRRMTTNVQQEEQLLQRLQVVRLHHDEIRDIPQKVVPGVVAKEEVGFEDERLGGESTTGEEKQEEMRFLLSKEEEAVTNQTENSKNERLEVEHVTTERTSSPTMPDDKTCEQTTRNESDDLEDDQRDHMERSDLLHIDIHERSCPELPLISAGHRLSAAETSMEKQIHEAVQGKQNLQRAGGVFNLADNPDVLEIPFKTLFSFEVTKACAGQHSHWQFSENKMQKDISQDIQKELVLVGQGRIPGGYSKGEVRQLKETKLLFEAFHEHNTEDPTKNQKARSSTMAGNVYPSVLERTRSLEMFSQKSCPVSRAHSLRVHNSKGEESPENFSSRSPTGVYQDSTRLTPYLKQDKNLRLHRSMDSICSHTSASSVEAKGKARTGHAGQQSPILLHNPFFKLRPALALQPEVEKDIREAREREEELRRQRCSLYGEHGQKNKDEEKSQSLQTLRSDVRQKSRGKLERVWPPPSTKDQSKPENSQEPKLHVVGGQKAALWQRWESGLINRPTANEEK